MLAIRRGGEALGCFNLTGAGVEMALPGGEWKQALLRGFGGATRGTVLSLAPYSAAFFVKP